MQSSTSLGVSPLRENGSIAAQSSAASHLGPIIARNLLNTHDDSGPQAFPGLHYPVLSTAKPLAPFLSSSHPHDLPRPLPTLPPQDPDRRSNSIDGGSRFTSSGSEDNGGGGAAEGGEAGPRGLSDNAHAAPPPDPARRIRALLSDNLRKAEALAELQSLFERLAGDYERVSAEARSQALALASLRAHADALAEALRATEARGALQAERLARERAEGASGLRRELSESRAACEGLRKERGDLLEGHRLLRGQLEALQESLASAKDDAARRLGQKLREAEAAVRAGFREKERLLELREQELAREACHLEEGLRRFAAASTEAKEDVLALRWRLRELERAGEKKDALRAQLESALEQTRASAAELQRTITSERQAHEQRQGDLQAGWRAEVAEVRRLCEIAQADRARAEELLQEAHKQHDEELARKEREKRELWKDAGTVEWELRRELKQLKAALNDAREEASQYALDGNRAQREADAASRSRQLLENQVESLKRQLLDAELAKSQLAAKLEMAYTKVAGKEKEAEALRCTIEREWWAQPREIPPKTESGDVRSDPHACLLPWRRCRSGSYTFDEFRASPEQQPQREERKDRAKVAFVASPGSGSGPPAYEGKRRSTGDQGTPSASPQARFEAHGTQAEGEGEHFYKAEYRPARRRSSMMRATDRRQPPPQQTHLPSSPKESPASRSRAHCSWGLVESIERTTRGPSQGNRSSYSPHPYCVDEDTCNEDAKDSGNAHPSHHVGAWDIERRLRRQARTAGYCDSDDSEMKGGVYGASPRMHFGEPHAWHSPGLSFSQPYPSSNHSPRTRSKSQNLGKGGSGIFFDPDGMGSIQSSVPRAPRRARSSSERALHLPLDERGAPRLPGGSSLGLAAASPSVASADVERRIGTPSTGTQDRREGRDRA